MHRFVASALNGFKLGDDGQWSSALIYGVNKQASAASPSHSVLVESEAVLDRANTVFGRAELLQKTAHDLVLPAFDHDRTFTVSAMTLGAIREVGRKWGATLGIGASGTVNIVPAALESTYGSRTPLGAIVFLRLRPVFAKVDPMAGMKM